MSTSTSLRIGYFILASCKQEASEETVLQCSGYPGKNGHDVHKGQKFCSLCGSPVVMNKVPSSHKRSLSDVLYDTGAAWAENLTEADKDFLTETFNVIEPEWVGADTEYDDVIVMNNTVAVDADQEGIHDLPTNISEPPCPIDIERLYSIMKYVTYELRFGVLVVVG